MIKTEDGLKYVPELYAVSAESVNEEYRLPGSQDRIAVGRVPFMWAQSLYIIAQLLKEVRIVQNLKCIEIYTLRFCRI